MRSHHGVAAALAFAVAAVSACGGSSTSVLEPSSTTSASSVTVTSPPTPTFTTTTLAPRYLQPGADPSVLPAAVLIADRGNDRLIEVAPNGETVWEFPLPGDLPAGETFKVPDDAFFSPDGLQIIATEEDDFMVSVIDVASRKIVWRYGTPGSPGSGPNHLNNPDDAIILGDGSLLVADIKNCRLATIAPGATVPSKTWGVPGGCTHDPPRRFSSPNGAFPMANGHFLVTEIGGAWVDEVDLATGALFGAVHPPAVAYPSDTNEVRPSVWLTVDYSKPGRVVEFDPTGKALWTYAPTGAAALNKPSLARPLPNGDVIVNDDFNHRVIVIDPRTDQIVWQYGVTGTSGRIPGRLNIPDGLDFAPPFNLLAGVVGKTS